MRNVSCVTVAVAEPRLHTFNATTWVVYHAATERGRSQDRYLQITYDRFFPNP